MKIAYFDCFAGAGGDMINAALLDAGLDEAFLRQQLAGLGIDDLKIEISQAVRGGISARQFRPVFGHQHHHRHLSDIKKIIENSMISEKASKNAVAVFEILAQAEARVHHTTPDKIHFHEVGALDSIADVVAACIGLDAMGIDKVISSPFSVGGGTVKCDHGIMPVPAPATLEILRSSRAPFKGGPIDKELLTPTAAALLTFFTTEYGSLPAMRMQALGYGAGTLDPEGFPNVLRVIIGEIDAPGGYETDTVCIMETNIDDASGEKISYVCDKLFENEALDVWTTPIYMKHNRPGVKLSILCEQKNIQNMQTVIFSEGLTLGLRVQNINRTKLSRRFYESHTPYGVIKIKAGYYDGRAVFAKCEHADCVRAAKEYGQNLDKVKQRALEIFWNSIV